ncbi:MAG: GIY-YIG nuclease family protein [Flavobacteriales bacterium]|nr:GIY-YIG nuclease family protein [Flavobacteriales bacterium]
MKKEFIFSARDLYENHPSKESWIFWVMKYIDVLAKDSDYKESFSFREGVKTGIKRKDYILTQTAYDNILKRTKTIFSIYALKCPIENIIKYVGCSVNVYSRVAQIFSDMGNQRKLEWAGYLREKGLKPEILILEECSTFDEAVIAEQKHINEHRDTIFNSKSSVLYRNNTINNWKNNYNKSKPLTKNQITEL